MLYQKILNKSKIAFSFAKRLNLRSLFIEIGCLGTYNVGKTEKFRNLKYQNPDPGLIVSLTTSYKWLAHETLMLKSDFDLIHEKSVGCCVAVQYFRKFS